MTASFIWEHCNGSNSIEDIATLLSENFDISFSESNEDVKAVINQLKSFDLLETN